MNSFYEKTARVGLARACWRLIQDPHRAWWQRLFLALTPMFVVWLLSPLDIAPELILGPLGLADDGAILITMIILMRLAINFYGDKKYKKPNQKVDDKDIIDL